MIRARPDAVVEVPTASIAAPRRHSIRASLIALVGACLAPALLVSGYVVHENYTQHRAHLERDAVLQARSLAAALDREFSGVVSGLRVLSTSPDLAAGELRAFHERARGALAFQIVDNYVMTDRQGRPGPWGRRRLAGQLVAASGPLLRRWPSPRPWHGHTCLWPRGGAQSIDFIATLLAAGLHSKRLLEHADRTVE